MLGRRRIIIALITMVVLLTVCCTYIALNYLNNSDQLWKIVSQQCVPGQEQRNDPSPCRQVNIQDGYVVLKDRNGALQFLLMPVAKVTGVESQKLLNPASPNYLAEAWRARHFMEERYGAVIDDQVYSLAVNSRWGRTQDQLHIHISCLRADIRQQLDALAPRLNDKWQSQLLGEHEYQIRMITRDEFKRTSPFIRLANELPGARENMGSYGIAIAALGEGKRAMMVVKSNLLMLNRASAEELQDHSCALLKVSGGH
ncbi:CDP-diacylglycerol diphosphatase [Erwinia sorbitola]|uniref:CDP-diacylglycerol pyrophosphatase n=1 Tax=Erwinia sorbitola TaxID=2681984 RepID=A0A6I6EI86_9GAMM|nr:CDP-diacylglycerol diphosphatase [Erwinia sorbitola]QGU89444.1 CDP-diacylglycerol diphosphatase [Erwinia sorbitola]